MTLQDLAILSFVLGTFHLSVSSMFPSYLGNIRSPETQPCSSQFCPRRKFVTLDWLPELRLLLGLPAGWAFSLPLPIGGSSPQGDTTEAREDPTGRKRQGKDDGKREGTSTEIYFLQKRIERNDFCP